MFIITIISILIIDSEGVEFDCDIFHFIINSGALSDISNTKMKYKTVSIEIKYNN